MVKIHFHMVNPFGPFWSVKYLSFGQNTLKLLKIHFIFQSPSVATKRNNHTFRTYNAETVQNGTEILLFIGPKILSLFPSNTNNSDALEMFKQKVSYWKPDSFPCRLFKTYIKDLGYL